MRPSEIVAEVPACDAADTEVAVAAAHDAYPDWAATPAPQRGNLLVKAADVLERRVEQLARDMTRELGKPLREARVEAARGAAILLFFGGEGYRPLGELYQQSLGGGRVFTMRRPLGVVGLITPWNFPAARSAPSPTEGLPLIPPFPSAVPQRRLQSAFAALWTSL